MITIIIPIINPNTAAPLVIQGNQTNPNRTIINWKAMDIDIPLNIIIAGFAKVAK